MKYEQFTIFDYINGRPYEESPEEPEVGAYVKRHGANICHIMRPAYIGKKVVMDKSTVGHAWYQVGILEDYFPYENTFRAIIYDGRKQRNLVTFRPGVEIFECLPWDAYNRVEKRRKNE